MTSLVSSPRAQLVLATCACAGATAILYTVDPNRTNLYPTCPLYQRTGIYCAGCGATRAAFALVHGRVLEAMHDNILLVAAVPFLLWQGGRYFSRVWREETWPELSLTSRQLGWFLGLGLGLMLLFMILRNLPFAPFTLLAPIPASVHFPGVQP